MEYQQRHHQNEDDELLEDRLEQIKNNIKYQQKGAQKTEQSIEKLEDVLNHQRKKLESIQDSQNQRASQLVMSNYSKTNGTPFNGEKSKEMIEFELSEASPIRKSHGSYGTGHYSVGYQGSASAARVAPHHQATTSNPAGSSSVNLEKAYEELEKEIQEIKAKLHQSISNNES